MTLRILSQEGIAYLRSKYPPLRGELWYRREPALSGAQTGKKFLDVYFLEETLPELLDLLLGKEGGHGIGLAPKQVALQCILFLSCVFGAWIAWYCPAVQQEGRRSSV